MRISSGAENSSLAYYWGELKKRWFILSLILVIVIAKAYPYLGSKEGKLDVVNRAARI